MPLRRGYILTSCISYPLQCNKSPPDFVAQNNNNHLLNFSFCGSGILEWLGLGSSGSASLSQMSPRLQQSDGLTGPGESLPSWSLPRWLTHMAHSSPGDAAFSAQLFECPQDIATESSKTRNKKQQKQGGSHNAFLI